MNNNNNKRTWKAGNLIYPLPAVMISCGDFENKETHNIITIGWVGTINTNPPMTYISVRETRYSFDLLNKYKSFVINLTTTDLAKATDFCGVRSGRDFDKFKHCNLTPIKSKEISAPSILESPINIECSIKSVQKLGSHYMFIADILSVSVDEQYFDENDTFRLDKAKPICYSHGGYYEVGDFIGKFGFSVMKNKTKKKLYKSKNVNKKK